MLVSQWDRIGNIEIAVEDEVFVFRQKDATIRIGSDGLDELISYLRSSSQNRFNQRRSFRIPVFPDSGLTIGLVIKNAAIRAVPRDISMSGIFVEFDQQEFSHIELGFETTVSLGFRGQTLNLPATLRRKEATGWAMEFIDINDSQIAPVVMELQRQWLAKRSHN